MGGTMTREQILNAAINTWGQNAQLDMMVEEMSELAKAICKYKRGAQIPRVLVEQIREEMADVQIVLDQLKIMFGKVEGIETEKLERLKGRIKREATR